MLKYDGAWIEIAGTQGATSSPGKTTCLTGITKCKPNIYTTPTPRDQERRIDWPDPTLQNQERRFNKSDVTPKNDSRCCCSQDHPRPYSATRFPIILRY